MTEIKMKKNLLCFGTQYEYKGQTYKCNIFAKTEEEAKEMIEAKKKTEKINGQIIARYCLNPNEIEEESVKEYSNFLKDTH